MPHVSVVYSRGLGSEVLQVHEIHANAAAAERGSRLIRIAVEAGLLVVIIREDGTRSLTGPPAKVAIAKQIVESSGLTVLTDRG